MNKLSKGSTGYNRQYRTHGYRPLRYTWQASHVSIINPLATAIARLTGKAAAT